MGEGCTGAYERGGVYTQERVREAMGEGEKDGGEEEEEEEEEDTDMTGRGGAGYRADRTSNVPVDEI